MKKPTFKSRKWNRIHIHNLNKRRNIRRSKLINHVKINKLGTYITILCPKDFSLDSNFKEVMNILGKIRFYSQRQRNERIYIDLSEIKELSPPAALILAAEIDRWNRGVLTRKCNFRRVVDLEEWTPKVRRLLADMGFFELLKLNYREDMAIGDSRNTDVRYVKFRTGTGADGEVIRSLRMDDLEPIVGPMPGKTQFYAAVTEAMTNVVHHSGDKNEEKRWWLSASYRALTREVRVMIYDQGVGIPETLPRKFQEQLRRLLPGAAAREDHARMVQAAHELSRTGTGMDHRGHGLQRDIRGYFDHVGCEGHYRVTSLRGRYVYERHPDGQTNADVASLPVPLKGTLIEWKLSLGGS